MNVIHALSSLVFFLAGENIDSRRDKRWKADSRRSRDFYHVKRLFDLGILNLIHIAVNSCCYSFMQTCTCYNGIFSYFS